MKPIWAGSRDAPMTATAAGCISGRIDATVATAWRRSAATTDPVVAFNDSSTVMQRRSDFERISYPDSWNTSSIAAFSGGTSASNRRNPADAASVASRSSRIVPRPFP